MKRPHRYVHILKLSDGILYVGQTNNLPVRIQEHKDGQQAQTKGKAPRLVFSAVFKGERNFVNELENKLNDLNKTGVSLAV